MGKGDFEELNDDKLCSMGNPVDRNEIEALKVLVKDPEYICSTCGRASSKAEILCKPEML
jgi:hypothetical protein